MSGLSSISFAGGKLADRIRKATGASEARMGTKADTGTGNRRSLAPATAIALGSGAVFALGLMAALAPLGGDTAPRLAASDNAATLQIARAALPAAETAVQASVLPGAESLRLAEAAEANATTALTTGAVPMADESTGNDGSSQTLRGTVRNAADPIEGIRSAFNAEADDTAGLMGPPEPVRQTTEVTVKSGDTLSKILTNAGVPASEARAAVNSLSKVFKPRELRVGQQITIEVETPAIEVAALETDEIDAPESALMSFAVKADAERTLSVLRNAEEGFEAKEVMRELTPNVVRAEGTIDDSLFLATDRIGVPAAVTIDFMKLYAYSVDFQREIRKGDKFEIYYTEFLGEDGERVKTGDILYASLSTGRKPLKLWRFEIPGEGTVDYFDENGQSMRKFLMKTPIDGARISSTFGMRRHPVLGYSKLHSGVDFAAPTGTPIYAAGNGTIAYAGWKGANGKLIYINHANGYRTAYAHLSRIARGVTKGARVSQGQIIGYVGTTGRSTGPHLHYEVKINGKPTNPMTLRVPTGRKLEGKALTAFRSARDTISAEMASIEPLTLKATKEARLDAAGESTIR